MRFLEPERGGVYVDATVGPGGHSEELLKRLPPEGRLIAFDRDEDALRLAGERLKDGRCTLRKGRFSLLYSLLGGSMVDGMLFDLGVSMDQLKRSGRGFSFSTDEPLDMRMDASQALTAGEIVNSWSEKELRGVISEYGEERAAGRISMAIVRARPIRTSRELARVIEQVMPRRGRIHPATRTFQALRIAVNDELEELKAGLSSASRLLKPGGRLVVISYHSLEDRIVKNFLRDAGREGIFSPLTKKPLTPGQEEVRRNPSARSAKLRAGQRL